MSNVGLHLNHQQLVDVATKLNCLSGEIGKVVKTSLIEEKTSKYYRPLFGTSEEKNIEFDLDAWLKSTPLGEIVNRKSKLESKPVFTPV